MVFFPAFGTQPFLLTACPYLHPQPLHLLKPHWPLPVFLTSFTFPRKTTMTSGFCDPFSQALYTCLPPQNLVCILPVLLSSLSSASLLKSLLPTRSLSLLTASWHFPPLSCSCPSSPPSIPADSLLESRFLFLLSPNLICDQHKIKLSHSFWEGFN